MYIYIYIYIYICIAAARRAYSSNSAVTCCLRSLTSAEARVSHFFSFFDPAGLPYKYLVFAPEVDRRSSRDFEWTDL